MMKVYSQHPVFALAATLLVFVSSAVHAEDGICEAEAIQFTTTDQLGPFYVPNSPMSGVIAPRQFLVDPTEVFVVSGKVLGSDCVPLAKARVEAWYSGEEDELGDFYSDTNYRGQVFTGGCGEFQFTQTFPALYPGRPVPHIHYRIESPDGMELLVTQLYFEGVIPSQFNPDDTKISKIINEADGSRSAEFHVYVSIPGTADLDACGESSGEDAVVLIPGTMLPNAATNATETMVPTEGASLITNEGAIIDDEEATIEDEGAILDDEGATMITKDPMESSGQQCGNTFCGAPLECCNESCGTCVEPGGVCTMIGCVGDTTISKAVADMFDR